MAPLAAASSVAKRSNMTDYDGRSTALEEAEEERMKARTEQQKEDWMDKYDDDKSGTLDRAEFVALVNNVAAKFEDPILDPFGALSGLSLAPTETADAQTIDVPESLIDKAFAGRDVLDSDQAHAAAQRVLLYMRSREKLRVMFSAADLDKDDNLSAKELRSLLQRGAPPGYTVTLADCEHVIKRADVNGDSKVNMDELGPAIACWMDLANKLAGVPETPRTKAASSACVLL